MPADPVLPAGPDTRDEQHVQEAPIRFVPMLRQLGPGLIIAGSIVGSGELIATTKTGAQAGIALLWLIILGCVIKVFAQIEMGRHSITHGQTSLEALNQIPGKIMGINFIVWFWLLMMLSGIVQLGGIVGGVGQAAAIAIPLSGDYREAIQTPSAREIRWLLDWEQEGIELSPRYAELSSAQQQRVLNGTGLLRERLDALGENGLQVVAAIKSGTALPDPYTYDDKYWALAATAITAILLGIGRYSIIQNLTTILVVTFTFVTVGNFLSLQSTAEWSISTQDILQGLSFGLPIGTGDLKPLATALATFGIIGVGAAELVAYPYWCLEKGYAKHVGPRDNSIAWEKRARGWIRVMHLDVLLSMFVYTVATIAFYFMGVAVLYRMGRDPEGMRMTSTLAEAYVPIFGEYARWLFLIGAIAVLYSTFLVANASHSRLFTDFFKLLGVIPRSNPQAHWRSISGFGIGLPILCLVIFCSNIRPDAAVLAAGLMQSLMLPLLGIGVIFFRYRQTDARLKPSLLFDICLLLSCIGFFITGFWSFSENIGGIWQYLAR